MYKLIIAAFFLDLLLGDPDFRLHPIRLIGKLIAFLENIFYRMRNKFIGGILTAVITVAFVFVAVHIIIKAAHSLSAPVGYAVEILALYFSLSLKELAHRAKIIHRELTSGHRHRAREHLALIVSRETDAMSENEIRRGTIESVAENSVDGFISPLFFAFLGGAPLALAYKAVNTLDSMLGYKNKRYISFGKFSARLDDIANFVPARLAVILIAFAAFFVKLDWKSAFTTVLKYGNKNPSPNAGLPEAAYSGALGIVLGGRSTYGGASVQKPLIGEGRTELHNADIIRSVRLLYATALVAVTLFSSAYLLLKAWGMDG